MKRVPKVLVDHGGKFSLEFGDAVRYLRFFFRPQIPTPDFRLFRECLSISILDNLNQIEKLHLPKKLKLLQE